MTQTQHIDSHGDDARRPKPDCPYFLLSPHRLCFYVPQLSGSGTRLDWKTRRHNYNAFPLADSVFLKCPYVNNSKFAQRSFEFFLLWFAS